MNTLAIVVNYKSADMTFKAVQSVLDSDSLGKVHVAVVDNSKDAGEAARLRRGLPPSVRFRVSPENIGFGRACNLAFEDFRGDAILLLNPDARLLPSCLIRLQETLLASENTGAVSPQIFWDEGHRFYLPASFPPPSLLFQDFLEVAPADAGITRFLSGIWRHHSIKVWEAKEPVRVRNLSGGLVLLRRRAVKVAGGLFDPRFFLYFEDTDLFLRMQKASFTLLVEPRAQAMHHYDQCAQEDLEQKRSAMALSRRRFGEKHLKGWRPATKRMISCLVRLGKDGREGPSPTDFVRPFSLEVPCHLQDEWLFEVSPNANFIPSAARFGRGPLMDFPEDCWNLLAPGRYFGRLGSPRHLLKYAQRISWTI
jgi:GT2 family glycosyltransferase